MQSSLPDVPDPLDADENCKFASRVGAYFDGELDPRAAAQLRTHLNDCPLCSSQLNDIGVLSEQAKLMFREEISSSAVHDIHRGVDADDRYVIFRIAAVLTGLAASLLVVGTVWLNDIPSRNDNHPFVVLSEKGPDWSRVAVDIRVDPLPHSPWEVNERPIFEDTRLAQWVVDGLTGGANEKQIEHAAGSVNVHPGAGSGSRGG